LREKIHLALGFHIDMFMLATWPVTQARRMTLPRIVTQDVLNLSNESLKGRGAMIKEALLYLQQKSARLEINYK
jgi:hypothetical protein